MTEPLPGFDNVRPLLADELGITYLANRASQGPDVAVRLLDLTVPGRPARRQFRNACQAAATLNAYPGFLPLLELDFTSDHHPYLVTEIPSGTLAARLTAGPLPPPVAIGLTAALARTLITAHAAGVLHLDVRPANVLRTATAPTPLLAHFGVSRAIAAAGRTELPIECLVNASRELFGWDTPGPPADIYGLASTLYSMLSGQAPYAAEARLGRAALYQRTLRGGPPAISRPGIPPTLMSLITAMMDPNPSSRPTLPEVIETLGTQTPTESALTAAWPLPPPPPVKPEPSAATPASPPTRPEPDPTPASLPPPDLAPAQPPRPPAPAPAPIHKPSPPDPSPEPGETVDRPRRRGDGRQPADGRRPGDRRRHVGPMLLVAAGVVALLAGFVWGIVTGSRHSQPRAEPTVRATSSAGPVSPAQLKLYRATDIQISAKPSGIVVRWTAPVHQSGVTAYLVVAELDGAEQQEHTVGLTSHSTVFAGLERGLHYCFVVGTLIESTGQASTAAAAPVCMHTHHASKKPNASKKHGTSNKHKPAKKHKRRRRTKR